MADAKQFPFPPSHPGITPQEGSARGQIGDPSGVMRHTVDLPKTSSKCLRP